MLDLSLFAGDPEAAEYRLRAELQTARAAFRRSRIYPHLADLVRLRRALRAVLDHADGLRNRPGRVTGIDWEKEEVTFAPSEWPADHASGVEDLARWALPLVETAIGEGQAVYDFVEETTHVAAVGLVPAYVDEGYLLVPQPESAASPFAALRYACGILTASDARYRSLRTAVVALPDGLAADPVAWKRALARTQPDLPNPATYLLDAEVGFPIRETVLPVAKRKLLRLIAAPGQS
jgi:hypothetical protein